MTNLKKNRIYNLKLNRIYSIINFVSRQKKECEIIF